MRQRAAADNGRGIPGEDKADMMDGLKRRFITGDRGRPHRIVEHAGLGGCPGVASSAEPAPAPAPAPSPAAVLAPAAVVAPAAVLDPDDGTEDRIPSWTGFYVGGHLGGAVVDWESETSFVATSPAKEKPTQRRFQDQTVVSSTFVGGVHGGYNWQSANYVFGLEATASALAEESSDHYTISSATLIAADLAAITDPVDGFVSDWSRSVDWLATARARAGYLVNPTAFLYLTGGLAVGEVRSDASYTGLVDQGIPTLVSVSADSRETQVGYAVGGGAEAALTDRLSVRAEYLYVDLGEPIGRWEHISTAHAVFRQFPSMKTLQSTP